MKVSTVLEYVRKFEDATRCDEMRGSFHPDIRDEVHEEFKRAKKRLNRAIRELAQ
jgi:hypothetical protein